MCTFQELELDPHIFQGPELDPRIFQGPELDPRFLKRKPFLEKED
jgi:hypothetical protein